MNVQPNSEQQFGSMCHHAGLKFIWPQVKIWVKHTCCLKTCYS